MCPFVQGGRALSGGLRNLILQPAGLEGGGPPYGALDAGIEKENPMMSKIGKAFLTGLAAVLPIAITAYVLWRLCSLAENAVWKLANLAFPTLPYIPGVGVVAVLVAIFLVGLALNMLIARRLFALGEKILHRMPVVRTVYGAARDLIGFFSESKERAMRQVVIVTTGENNFRQIGFVTREDFSDCPQGMAADEDTIAVYLPNSCELGGTTALVPRSAVQPIDMSFQDAMRFALTAGMSPGEKKAEG